MDTVSLTGTIQKRTFLYTRRPYKRTTQGNTFAVLEMEKLWNLMWLKGRREQRQPMSPAQEVFQSKAASTPLIGIATDATPAGGAHLAAENIQITTRATVRANPAVEVVKDVKVVIRAAVRVQRVPQRERCSNNSAGPPTLADDATRHTLEVKVMKPREVQTRATNQ